MDRNWGAVNNSKLSSIMLNKSSIGGDPTPVDIGTLAPQSNSLASNTQFQLMVRTEEHW